MLRVVFTFLLVMHGLAHVTGLLGHLTSGSSGFPDGPWLFSTGVTAHSAVGQAWGLLWLLALVGLVGTGLGLGFRQAWWPSLALAAAVVSLVAMVPWLKVVPPGAWAGVLLDLLIIVVLASPWAERVVDALH